MDQKQQIILHANSHGDRSQFSSEKESNNSFSNLVISPIKGVNKVGLLYAAIPKLFDTITPNNNRFGFYMIFDNYRAAIWITLPLINYIGSRQEIVVDELKVVDPGGTAGDPDVRGSTARANFVEILMLKINDGLRVYSDQENGQEKQEAMEIREYGCVVNVDNLGRLAFTFGMRTAAVEVDSVLGENFTIQFGDTTHPVNKRLCMMLGIPFGGVTIIDNRVSNRNEHFREERNPAIVPIAQRGSFAVHSRNYVKVDAAGDDFDVEMPMVTFTMFRPPEIRPPSFMFLQLHTTGLQCIALGHENEVSCWALQTANSGWKSQRSNNGIRGYEF